MAKETASFEDLQKKADKAKKARQDARAAIETFAKENGLNPKQLKKVEDKKLKKALAPLQEAFNTAKAAEEAANEAAKGAKPKTERTVKYVYPADCTTDGDKKKFRAAERAKAKKAEKGDEKPAKAEKSEKKAKKGEEAAPVEEKSSKKDKKAKKAKEASEDED